MATARAIGFSPRFDTLTKATLINREPESQGRTLSLAMVAEETLNANLDLRAAALGLQANQTNVDEARSSLWPQLNARLGHSRLNHDNTSSLAAPRPSIAAPPPSP